MIVTDSVQAYLEASRPEPDPLLAEMEAQGARERIPIVVPETGILLQILARTRGARRIVEVGTAIGVSALYMARALPRDGMIVSFEVDPVRHQAALRYFERAGLSDRADLRLQDARAGLAELEGPVDMAFIDGVKAQYLDYLDQLLPLLGPGGVLAVDNVLASGTVADGRGDGNWSDAQVEGLRAFNHRLVTDERFTSTITPVGDGLLIGVREAEVVR